MKALGIVRNLDNVGRLVIPKEMRNLMGINEGDELEIAQINNEIVVRKYNGGCIFCGCDNEAYEYRAVMFVKSAERL